MVEPGAKTYAVKDLRICLRQALRGNNSRLIPLPNSKWCVELSGFSPSLQSICIDDLDENIMKNTTLSAISAATDNTIQVLDPTGMEAGMLLTIILDDATKWTSVIDNVVGNIITFREDIPLQASVGSQASAGYGLVKVGRSGVSQTIYWECNDHYFVNCSSAYYISNTSQRGSMNHIKVGDLKYVGVAFVDNVNDNTFSDIHIAGGYNINQNFTGTGAQTTFDLTVGVNLERDLNVSVNCASQTLGVDYNFNSFNQIQFVVAPANGATITTYNFLDASIGLYQNNEYNTVPYAGNMVNLMVLDCSYGCRFRKGAISITDCLIDTVSNGILMDGQGTAVPLNFNNCFVGFYSITGIECKNNTIDPSISGNIHIKGTPTVYLPPGATLGTMIKTELNSVLYIQRDGIIAHDNFATQITNNGIIHWSGNNSILAQDGTVLKPSYSFGTQENIGLYKYSSTTIGASGNLLLSNSGVGINMGVPTGANNPSVNFFTSNTGSYSTASSRFQAYGGSGSASSGTIEINCAVLQNAVGFTGNKTTLITPTYTNLVGVSGLTTRNIISVREGSFNRLHIVIEGTMNASAYGTFTMTLFDRISNWTNYYDLFGHGSAWNAPPGTTESTGVIINARVGAPTADVGFAFTTSTSDAFVLHATIYYQRL